ncbi:hypothetical protein N9039_00005 [Verrucomicrobiales bacterium]|nr:hypothetical protein [Verrucomicrobiales bacterium]MDB4467642.1 hypothetical protein [Verrucomicrobiales bacterium]
MRQAQYQLGAQFYVWKRKYGEMDVAEARRLKALETDSSPA